MSHTVESNHKVHIHEDSRLTNQGCSIGSVQNAENDVKKRSRESCARRHGYGSHESEKTGLERKVI